MWPHRRFLVKSATPQRPPCFILCYSKLSFCHLFCSAVHSAVLPKSRAEWKQVRVRPLQPAAADPIPLFWRGEPLPAFHHSGLVLFSQWGGFEDKWQKQWIMGQGNSRAERLTKEDVIFLKANTNYDEDTIQVVLWQNPHDFSWQFAGVVQGVHLGLPQRQAQPSSLREDLQPVFPKWQCQGLLRPHLQDLRHGRKRLYRLQRVPPCYQRHIKRISRREVELGIQVIRTNEQLVFRRGWFYLVLNLIWQIG